MIEKAQRKILIISFDVPYPDNYGGVKDVWQTIKTLKGLGCEIDLVSFYRDENRVMEFEQSSEYAFINRHFAFKQKKPSSFFSKLPMSMSTRNISECESNAAGFPDDREYDVCIIEDVKCLEAFKMLSYYVKCKRTYLRLQNIESNYYWELFKIENNLFKAAFFFLESLRYRLFERSLWNNDLIDGFLFASEREMKDKIFALAKNKRLLRPALPVKGVSDHENRKNQILYVGNLDLPDNRMSVLRILEVLKPILSTKDADLVIAGKMSCEDKRWLQSISRPSVIIRVNPSDEELRALYGTAKLFFNYSMNASGVKMKLMEALSYGIPVLSNKNGVDGSGMEPYVISLERNSGKMLRDTISAIMKNRAFWKEMSDTSFSGAKKAINDAMNTYEEVVNK